MKQKTDKNIFKPLTRNKIITSQYKQSLLFPSSSSSSLSSIIKVTGKLLFPFFSWSKIHFPYESEEKELYGNKWQIKINLNNENYLGFYLINKMNYKIQANYEIRIKNHLNYSDFCWSDPEKELCFYSYGSGDHIWGVEDLIHIDDLELLENGYYYDDKIIFEIIITAFIIDELGALTPTTTTTTNTNNYNEKDDQIVGSNGHSITGSLESASNELNILSEKMSKKVRLLSEDAILQDKLISIRLDQQLLQSSQFQHTQHLQNEMNFNSNGIETSDSVLSFSNQISIHHSGSIKSIGSPQSKHYK